MNVEQQDSQKAVLLLVTGDKRKVAWGTREPQATLILLGEFGMLLVKKSE
jgi:hypothetical protein